MGTEQMTSEERTLLDSLKQAIIDLDEEKAVAAADKVVTSGIDPKLAIRYAIADAALLVGEKFDSGEYFLPQLVMSGDLMDVITKILEKNIPRLIQRRKNSFSLARFRQMSTVSGKILWPRCSSPLASML